MEADLRILLASLLDLRQASHAAHWGYQGESFVELHTLFQNQYTQILLEADRVAEFMRSSDYTPVYTLGDIITESILDCAIDKAIHTNTVIDELVRMHKALVTLIKRMVAIYTSSNVILTILADLEEYHSKQIWFMSNYLTGKRVGVRVSSKQGYPPYKVDPISGPLYTSPSY